MIRPRPEDVVLEEDSVCVKFVNATPYTLKVRWHRFNNKEYEYGFLAPKTFVIVKSFIGHKWSFRNEFDDYMIPRNNLPDNGENAQFYIVPSPANRNLDPSDPRYRHFQVFILNRIQSLTYYSIKKIIQACGTEGYQKLDLAPSIKQQISKVAKNVQDFKEETERNKKLRDRRSVN
ncbi:hypothetical protein FO519_004860 [Halicephalobus sp. NKZ332]|nr:hypothetical protein FO519_004860 [Halicephalobus sp. NKZ332]